MRPSLTLAELRSQIIEASAALLSKLQTEESAVEEPLEDGSRLVVEILRLPPPSTSTLRVLPDPEDMANE